MIDIDELKNTLGLIGDLCDEDGRQACNDAISTVNDLQSRLQAAESKLAELEEQEPVSYQFYDGDFQRPLYAKPVPSKLSEAIDLITELALDLKSEVDDRYSMLEVDKYPSMQSKYNCDIEVVSRAKVFVSKFGMASHEERVAK